jgi:outer membrane murein-binding lipoprotein Lpp
MKTSQYRLLAALMLGATLLSGCASHQASQCNLPQQLGAVFVQSLQFAHHSMDRIADDAAGCNQ